MDGATKMIIDMLRKQRDQARKQRNDLLEVLDAISARKVNGLLLWGYGVADRVRKEMEGEER
jgi:hypothetical protein